MTTVNVVAALIPAAFIVPQCVQSRLSQDSGPQVAERVVTLERASCYGTCPVYIVSVAGDGTVRFRGTAHVASTGEHTATIPRSRVDSLFAYVDSMSFARFDDAYTVGAAGCGSYFTDLPTVTVAVTIAGTTKRVTQDYGCGSAPKILRELHQRIDRVAETQRWIGAR